MSFRKRNVVIRSPGAGNLPRLGASTVPGIRPSPLDGRPTTSTGTQSLDQLLAGHAGQPLGTSMLIEEAGTTDFGGTLLRYFAAEGLLQGHHVHVLGVGDHWRRELPGVVQQAKIKPSSSVDLKEQEKMKIAWRYEALANQPAARADESRTKKDDDSDTFCHAFNLTKRLEASDIRGKLTTSPLSGDVDRETGSSLKRFIADIHSYLMDPSSSSVHRVALPNLLSPTLYPSTACNPQEILQFMHSLKSLSRQFPTRLTVLASIPISLHARSTGLVKWMEILSDGVIELVPFQDQLRITKSLDDSSRAQGMVRVHSLPVFHEKGGGTGTSWKKEDMSFRLSASSGLLITPYSLPPVDDQDQDQNSRQATRNDERRANDLEF